MTTCARIATYCNCRPPNRPCGCRLARTGFLLFFGAVLQDVCRRAFLRSTECLSPLEQLLPGTHIRGRAFFLGAITSQSWIYAYLGGC